MQRVLLAAVGVNRAADHYVRAEEVVVPTAPPASPTSEDDEIPGPRAASPRPTPQNGLKTTLERLREKERELDTALQRTYERFCRGEVTAREMDRERDGLVRAFNRLVMAENIRYGSMLGTDAGRRHGKR